MRRFKFAVLHLIAAIGTILLQNPPVSMEESLCSNGLIDSICLSDRCYRETYSLTNPYVSSGLFPDTPDETED